MVFIYFCGYILRILSDVLEKLLTKNLLHHSCRAKSYSHYSVKKSLSQTNGVAVWFAVKKRYCVLAPKVYRKCLCAEVGKTHIGFSANERALLFALYVAVSDLSVGVLFLRTNHDAQDVR